MSRRVRSSLLLSRLFLGLDFLELSSLSLTERLSSVGTTESSPELYPVASLSLYFLFLIGITPVSIKLALKSSSFAEKTDVASLLS